MAGPAVSSGHVDVSAPVAIVVDAVDFGGVPAGQPVVDSHG